MRLFCTEYHAPKPRPEPEQVVCQECHHFVSRYYAQRVEGAGYYCLEHKQPYTKVTQDHKQVNELNGPTWVMVTRYWKWVEVDKKGKIK